MTTPPIVADAGLGQTLVASFIQNGYSAFGLNRTVPQGAGSTMAVDLTAAGQTKAKLRNMICTHGAPKLAVHNTAKLVIAPFADISTQDFETTWRAMVLSAVKIAQVVLPAIAETGSGTFIVSGATASLRGRKNFSAFASAKAALRAMAQSLAREYGLRGIHVVHVILDGIVDTEVSWSLRNKGPSRMMKPEDISNTYLALANQPNSTWTHELDLRSLGEAF